MIGWEYVTHEHIPGTCTRSQTLPESIQQVCSSKKSYIISKSITVIQCSHSTVLNWLNIHIHTHAHTPHMHTHTHNTHAYTRTFTHIHTECAYRISTDVHVHLCVHVYMLWYQHVQEICGQKRKHTWLKVTPLLRVHHHRHTKEQNIPILAWEDTNLVWEVTTRLYHMYRLNLLQYTQFTLVAMAPHALCRTLL